MSHNKKLVFVAFISLQSAAMFASTVGETVMPGIEIPTNVSQAITDHATVHASHAQIVADEAANHAAVMQELTNHLTATEQAKRMERAKLIEAIHIAEKHQYKIDNGILKPGSDIAASRVYRKAIMFIKDHAKESLKWSYEALVHTNEILRVLPTVNNVTKQKIASAIEALQVASARV